MPQKLLSIFVTKLQECERFRRERSDGSPSTLSYLIMIFLQSSAVRQYQHMFPKSTDKTRAHVTNLRMNNKIHSFIATSDRFTNVLLLCSFL